MLRRAALAFLALGVACSSPAATKSDDDYRHDVTTGMRSAIHGELARLRDEALALQDAAPLPQSGGWDAQRDLVAIQAMQGEWVAMRSTYEHLEGVIDPLFADLDVAIDSRYETALAAGADAYLFDDRGFVGLDAIERVLYATTAPAGVVAYEQQLHGYVAAALPSTPSEALDFKTKLCARLVADVTALLARWDAATLDVDAAYRGLVSLVAEQKGELDAAARGAEESRYARRAMQDMRDNLEGVEAIYGLFRPWLASKPGGGDVDARIKGAIAQVSVVYGMVPGDDLPQSPATWNGASPSRADLATAFGQLFTAVSGAGDAQRDGALVHEMQRAAALLALR